MYRSQRTLTDGKIEFISAPAAPVGLSIRQQGVFAGEIIGLDPTISYEIRHENDWISRYAALNTLELVEIGQKVMRGDTISAAANTALSEEDLGVHVHFELLMDGKSVEPEFAGENY